MDDVAVNSGKTHCFNSAVAQSRQNVDVDFSGKNHLGHLQRGVVSHAAAFDDRLLDAHARGQFAQLLAAAVDHADLMPT